MVVNDSFMRRNLSAFPAVPVQSPPPPLPLPLADETVNRPIDDKVRWMALRVA